MRRSLKEQEAIRIIQGLLLTIAQLEDTYGFDASEYVTEAAEFLDDEHEVAHGTDILRN